MWINEINFDGEKIKGILVNDPNDLTNVSNGDYVEIPINQISDWLFATQDKTYGGFTIQAMRSEMSEIERQEHDDAWGLDFGDYNDILVAYEQKEKPENLTEHPMSINMKESLANFIKENPNELNGKDEFGYTFLHREAIAGNSTIVKVLLDLGADKNAKTNANKTARDFAESLKWEHLLPLL
jgi:ankyrin repeat protein